MQEVAVQKITPEFVPIKCPVCNGFGTVNFGKLNCKACDSKGYIKVPTKQEEKEGEEPNELFK
jgi:DnaJ-class molecular chaperone